MSNTILELLPDFLEVLGLDEYPMVFFTDKKPIDTYSPKPMELPTVEKEKNNEVDWQSVQGGRQKQQAQ